MMEKDKMCFILDRIVIGNECVANCGHECWFYWIVVLFIDESMDENPDMEKYMSQIKGKKIRVRDVL